MRTMDLKAELSKSKLETVKVVVRCRPVSEKEHQAGYHSVVTLFPESGGVEIHNLKQSPKYFTFDAVYDGGAQADLYDDVFRPLVDSVIDGFNGTIIAYGQTGAGKTYTMEGVIGDPEHEGVIPNSFKHIFSRIARSENTQYLVSASYLEIYQEEVRDLLSSEPKKKLEVRERNDTGVYVKDLTATVCKTIQDLEKVMLDGKYNRSIGTTNMNIHSSRSHAIFIIAIESCESDSDGNQHVKIGKLNLVDLAGSERLAKTGAIGSTQKESIKINLSLSALGNVISALVDGKSQHIPYRDSKLTRLLQDSLGGNAKTIMIANIGPASYNYEETMTTLRYANRAKNIKNKPVVNIDPKDAILLQYQQEISRLKEQLALKEAKKKKKKLSAKLAEDVIELDTSSVEIVKKMETLLEEERIAYLNEQNLMTEEKEKILRDIKAKDEELRLENEAKEKIRNQLQELEAKLLCGGKNIIDHTNEQERILEKRRQELAEQKRIEREIQQKLLQEEEYTLEKRETYDSLQQEVEIKTKKLKKLFSRLQALKEDISEEQEINSVERQDKEQVIETLTRDLKLSNLVIDNFVNPEDKSKFLEQVQFDEDEDAWVIYPAEMTYSHFNPSERPLSSLRRPMALHPQKIAHMRSNQQQNLVSRYKPENITAVDFVLPPKRTIDQYEKDLDPYAREAVKNVLSDETIDVQASLQNMEGISEPAGWGWLRFGTKTSAHSNKQQMKMKLEIEQYPVPRGLVPK
ncbi:kinesin-like protein KIF3B [Stegodyphus dumicola]|uniref:kinesin-like protein KIF3B n=1 Tax=Stegodyphus dumicola TaxID=202533 RepID=UPI0015AC291E|nr:kinesin-like protein KIF3B [Stegodyphus dumicola]XP_035227195.1 kinesin-like protein KIF3B [Stegodyphus dumicola]